MQRGDEQPSAVRVCRCNEEEYVEKQEKMGTSRCPGVGINERN
jgi:hypothetical protein